MRQRLAAGDLETARAVASGPSYLMVLADAVHAKLQNEYFAAVDPDTTARLGQLTETMTGATQAYQALSEHAHALIDWQAVDEIKKAGAASEAA